MKIIASALAFILLSTAAGVPLALAQKTAKRVSVAILDMEPKGVPEVEVSALSDRLRTELFRTDAFDVMERGKMQEILKEQGFQQSGACNTDACAVEVGQLIGVEKMIAGSLGKVGRTYSVNLRMIDVRTGRMERSVTKDYEGDIDKLLTSVMKSVAQTLAAAVKVDEQPKLAQGALPKPAAEGRPIYKKWWFYAGIGGLAAGGAAAALLGSKKTDGTTVPPADQTIPDPPARP